MSALVGLATSLVRRRWRTALVLALILGVGVGAGLSSIAAARRTASAYPRYLRAADAPDLVIDYSPRDQRQIDHLTAAALAVDGVEAVRDVSALNVAKITEDGVPDLSFPYLFLAPTDESTAIANRPFVVKGRLPRPDAANEVLVNQQLVEEKGVRLGDHLELIWASNDQVAKAEMGEEFDAEPVEFDVVGIGVLGDEVVVDDVAGETTMVGTEPFARTHQDGSSFHRMLVQAAPGTSAIQIIARLRATADESLQSQFLFQNRDTATAKAQRSLRPLTLGLGAVGAMLVAATLLLTGQALARQLAQEQDEVAVLRALGVTGSSRLMILLVLPLVVALGGVVVAASVAVALSPFGPVGAVRAVEVARGVHLDVTVLAGGALVVVLVLLLRGAVAARLATNPKAAGPDRASRIGAAISGLPITQSLGVRSSIEPGRGRARGAVNATIATATAAVVVVAGLASFDASRRHLAEDPALYGWTWDATLQAGSGYSPIDFEAITSDDAVGDIAAVSYASIGIGDDEVPAMLINPVRGAVLPAIVEGRAPRDPSEVALGHDTLARSGRQIGDRVRLDEPEGDTSTRTIVGVAVFPALGFLDTERANLGTGAFSVAPYDPTNDFGPSTALVRAAPGTSRAALLAHLAQAYTADVAADIRVFDRGRPADLASFERLGSGPMIGVALFVVAVIATLAHGIASAVRRRRRDHGLLRSLGFAPRQIRSIVIWQAITTMVIALVVGVPLGVVAGRAGWRAVASGIGTRVELVVPSLLLLGLAAGMVVAAVLVALIPARGAARVSPAEALRAE